MEVLNRYFSLLHHDIAKHKVNNVRLKISQNIRNIKSITESIVIQSEISNRIGILNDFLNYLKFHIMPPWGKFTEIHWVSQIHSSTTKSFVPRARTLRIAFLVSGIVSGFKNAFNPFGQETWIESLHLTDYWLFTDWLLTVIYSFSVCFCILIDTNLISLDVEETVATWRTRR